MRVSPWVLLLCCLLSCQAAPPKKVTSTPTTSVVPLGEKYLNEARLAFEKGDHETAALRGELAVDILRQQGASLSGLEPALLVTAQSRSAMGDHKKAAEFYAVLVTNHPEKKEYQDARIKADKSIKAAERAKRIEAAVNRLEEVERHHNNGELTRADKILRKILPAIKVSGDSAAIQRAVGLRKTLSADLEVTRRRQAAEARTYLAQKTEVVRGVSTGGGRGKRFAYESVSNGELIREAVKRGVRSREIGHVRKTDLPPDYLESALAGHFTLLELKSQVKRSKEWRKNQWIVRY